MDRCADLARHFMRFLHSLRRAIERLPPYPSLLLVAVPLALVEPFKVATLFIAGSGHWITGTIGMLCAYAISLLITERLFTIVKPKLLALPWFAKLWKRFVTARETMFGWAGIKWPPTPGDFSEDVGQSPKQRSSP